MLPIRLLLPEGTEPDPPEKNSIVAEKAAELSHIAPLWNLRAETYGCLMVSLKRRSSEAAIGPSGSTSAGRDSIMRELDS